MKSSIDTGVKLISLVMLSGLFTVLLVNGEIDKINIAQGYQGYKLSGTGCPDPFHDCSCPPNYALFVQPYSNTFQTAMAYCQQMCVTPDMQCLTNESFLPVCFGPKKVFLPSCSMAVAIAQQVCSKIQDIDTYYYTYVNYLGVDMCFDLTNITSSNNLPVCSSPWYSTCVNMFTPGSLLGWSPDQWDRILKTQCPCLDCEGNSCALFNTQPGTDDSGFY